MIDQDKWIFEATAIHLAAEYRPRNLQLILSSLNNELKEALIQNAHAQGKISPATILDVDNLMQATKEKEKINKKKIKNLF